MEGRGGGYGELVGENKRENKGVEIKGRMKVLCLSATPAQFVL